MHLSGHLVLKTLVSVVWFWLQVRINNLFRLFLDKRSYSQFSILLIFFLVLRAIRHSFDPG